MRLPRWTANTLLLLASLLMAVVLGEVGVRLYASWGGALGKRIVAWDPLGIKVEPHGEFGYRQRPGAVFEYEGGKRATTNVQGWRGPTVVIPKPPGTIRIVLLGGSTTYGWGVNDDETLDAYLRKDLAEQWPDHIIDVVNLALDGYDAYQAWQRWLSDGVRLQPDAVVVNTGINDVRNARFEHLDDPDPRTLIWEADMRRLREQEANRGPTMWTLAKHYSYLLRLPGVLRESLATPQRMTSPEEHIYADAADNFEKNVKRIVTSAGQLGIPVVLATPPSVLTRPDAPDKLAPRSYWVVNPSVTQAYRDTLASRLATIAHDDSTARHPVVHLTASVPSSLFLDDAHLSPAGNRLEAAAFARALEGLLGVTPGATVDSGFGDRPGH